MPPCDTPVVEPSEELRRVIERFFDATRDGDAQAVSNRLSREPGFERLGTDPDERWFDGEEAALIFAQQMRELGGGYPWHLDSEVRAYTEGNVGWGSLTTLFDTMDGPVPLRLTLVLHLEHGEWKIVQAHGSVPSTNAEHGFLLTTSVAQIAESVNEQRPDLSSTSASDGTVTIAFTDIEDSTRLNDVLGDQRWLEVLHAHNDVVKHVTADHGGTVVKNQGDGFMLAFPSARRALACAQTIDRRIGEAFDDPGSPIRVRIGVHTGEAVSDADDFFGHAVNYAARVASAARGGEILVSPLVYDLVQPTGLFVFGTAREVALKGIDGAVRLHPVAA
jgi:class 3 adenylate cyclase/ketosteroid isomerase-like protein